MHERPHLSGNQNREPCEAILPLSLQKSFSPAGSIMTAAWREGHGYHTPMPCYTVRLACCHNAHSTWPERPLQIPSSRRHNSHPGRNGARAIPRELYNSWTATKRVNRSATVSNQHSTSATPRPSCSSTKGPWQRLLPPVATATRSYYLGDACSLPQHNDGTSATPPPSCSTYSTATGPW